MDWSTGLLGLAAGLLISVVTAPAGCLRGGLPPARTGQSARRAQPGGDADEPAVQRRGRTGRAPALPPGGTTRRAAHPSARRGHRARCRSRRCDPGVRGSRPGRLPPPRRSAAAPARTLAQLPDPPPGTSPPRPPAFAARDERAGSGRRRRGRRLRDRWRLAARPGPRGPRDPGRHRGTRGPRLHLRDLRRRRRRLRAALPRRDRRRRSRLASGAVLRSTADSSAATSGPASSRICPRPRSGSCSAPSPQASARSTRFRFCADRTLEPVRTPEQAHVRTPRANSAN